MTNDRPYRKALPFETAREELISNSGHQFDPRVVEVFLSIPHLELERLRKDAEKVSLPGLGELGTPRVAKLATGKESLASLARSARRLIQKKSPPQANAR